VCVCVHLPICVCVCKKEFSLIFCGGFIIILSCSFEDRFCKKLCQGCVCGSNYILYASVVYIVKL